MQSIITEGNVINNIILQVINRSDKNIKDTKFVLCNTQDNLMYIYKILHLVTREYTLLITYITMYQAIKEKKLKQKSKDRGHEEGRKERKKEERTSFNHTAIKLEINNTVRRNNLICQKLRKP